MSATNPQQIIRGFNLKSSGVQDNGARAWVTPTGTIGSSTEKILIPPAAFLLAPDARFTSGPISMSGASHIRATKIEVTAWGATAYAPMPTTPFVTCVVSFDGGSPVTITGTINANADWISLLFSFDVPAGAGVATVTFIYSGGNNAPSCFFDDITINVLTSGDISTFLSRKFDEVAWLCAHNAFANYRDGWLWAQQSGNVTEQLKQGVRALMLDIDDVSNDIYLLHAGWTASMVMRPGFSAFRKLVDTLTEVNTFLDQNPKEIVTIFFQTDVTDPTGYQRTIQAFQNAGTASSKMADKIFAYDKTNFGRDGQSWNVQSQGAPTLQWMVDSNKRCVVFSSLRGSDTHSTERTAPDNWAKMWHFVRENVYGNDSIAAPQWVRERAESADADASLNRTLTLLNHFPDWAVGSLLPASVSFNSINDASNIRQHVSQWLRQFPRLPNYLAVDYISTGYHGGPLQAVLSLNEWWADKDLHPDPPPIGQLLVNGRSLDKVKADLEGTIGTKSRVAITWQNVSASDFTVLRSHARHGKIVDDVPECLFGSSDDDVREANRNGGRICAGVATTMAGLIGPQCFWIFAASGTDKVLFVAVTSPFALLLYNNYANARWIERTDAVKSFINTGDGGDALFDALYREVNDETSSNADVRVRVRPWICGTWAMRNEAVGDMTVTIWDY